MKSWLKGILIGAIGGVIIGLFLFIFFSDLGRGLRNPIEDLFRNAALSSDKYKICINEKIEEIKNLDPKPAISIYECMSSKEKKLWGIATTISNIKESFDGIFMFGYFGYIIWFGFIIILAFIGALIGWTISKIKS